MIHIVFNEADISTLEAAIALDESLQGDIVQIKDDYAVGPLKDIYLGEGLQARNEWWAEVLTGGDYEASIGTVNDNQTAAELTGKMRRNEEEVLWIWAAQNKHDVCGYYWLLHFVKEFQGRVYILYLNNLPFINEKGNIFYPQTLSEIPPKEFLKAKKLARIITPSEFEVDPDEWAKLSDQNAGVRLLEGGKKIANADYDYYDADLKKYILKDWQKAGKIIQNFLSKSKETTGDAYLLWRLKYFVSQDLVHINGHPGKMKEFEIKLKS